MGGQITPAQGGQYAPESWISGRKPYCFIEFQKEKSGQYAEYPVLV